MRLVIVSFFSGILLFQQFSQLPDIQWCLLFVLIVPLYYFYPVFRVPLALASGFLWALIHAAIILSNGLSPQIEGKDIILEGIISAIPEQRPDGVRFQFDIQGMHDESVVQYLLVKGKSLFLSVGIYSQI